MNWKVRFHSHGSSLVIDSNTQRQQVVPFFEPQTKSMRQLAPPPKTRRAPQRGMKKMSRADSQAETTRQTDKLLKRVMKNIKKSENCDDLRTAFALIAFFVEARDALQPLLYSLQHCLSQGAQIVRAISFATSSFFSFSNFGRSSSLCLAMWPRRTACGAVPPPQRRKTFLIHFCLCTPRQCGVRRC